MSGEMAETVFGPRPVCDKCKKILYTWNDSTIDFDSFWNAAVKFERDANRMLPVFLAALSVNAAWEKRLNSNHALDDRLLFYDTMNSLSDACREATK